jgi:hypothetical protein
MFAFLPVSCELVRKIAARPASNDATAGMTLLVLTEGDPGLLAARPYVTVGGGNFILGHKLTGG